jgi:hypothetical protein
MAALPGLRPRKKTSCVRQVRACLGMQSRGVTDRHTRPWLAGCGITKCVQWQTTLADHTGRPHWQITLHKHATPHARTAQPAVCSMCPACDHRPWAKHKGDVSAAFAATGTRARQRHSRSSKLHKLDATSARHLCGASWRQRNDASRATRVYVAACVSKGCRPQHVVQLVWGGHAAAANAAGSTLRQPDERQGPDQGAVHKQQGEHRRAKGSARVVAIASTLKGGGS